MRVLIVVLGLICAASAFPRQSRIVGGQNTNIESFPFMSAMLSRWSGGFSQTCGGTLITPTAVASAAQCFSNVASSLRVRLGSIYANSGGSEHVVSRIIRHAEYNARLSINDVAVVRLSVSASLSDKINLARIAGPNYILPPNTAVNATGWGHTEYGGKFPEILQQVQLNIIDQQICAARYAYLKTLPGMSNWPDVTPEMLCAGILDVGGKDGCHGDSGGPIIHNKDVLVGILSWGYECAHPIYPGVNARVSSYTNWFVANSVN